jgi:hypothetical protein
MNYAIRCSAPVTLLTTPPCSGEPVDKFLRCQISSKKYPLFRPTGNVGPKLHESMALDKAIHKTPIVKNS